MSGRVLSRNAGAQCRPWRDCRFGSGGAVPRAGHYRCARATVRRPRWSAGTGSAVTTCGWGQALTAPIVKPAMKRSSSRLNVKAIGMATNTAAACSDCQ